MPERNSLPDPWERQPGESPQAFAAFAKYRDLGLARSHAAVAREVGKNKGLIDRWGSRWAWQARIAAHDRYLDAARVAKRLAAFVKEDEDEGTALAAAFGKTLDAVRGLTSADLKGSQSVLALVKVIEARRLRRGEPTARVDETVRPGAPVAAGTPEDLLRELLERDPDARKLADELGYRLAGRDAGPAGGGDVEGGVAPDPAPPVPRPDAG